MARLIARAPYRGLFAAETLIGTAYIALASGLAIKVGEQTHNSALVALLVALNALPVLGLSQFVTPTLERFGFEGGIVDLEKLAAAPVKAALCVATHGLPAFGQLACGSQTNLVQHPAEIDEAVYLIERAAESGDDRGVGEWH